MRSRILPTLFLLPLIFIAAQSRAQTYCTPTMTTGGMYIMDIYYSTLASGITGGADQINGSNGYINNSGSSAGTITRNCTVSLYYHLYNPTAGTQSYNFRVFADWNNDGDFDDAGEIAADIDGSLNAATSLGTGLSFAPNPTMSSSTVRIRWALRQGGSKATSCGGYTGEIEDYKVTVPANTAPVLNNAGTPLLNALTQTQTTSPGQNIETIMNSTLPGTTMMTDADACSTIKGMAITAVTATNGQWQYLLPGGSWTNFGAVSSSNALLLYSDNSHDTRIRFVPTGAGTSSIDFRAWDRSMGSNGSYYNIISTGGTTAFSTATETASLVTYSSASTAADIKAYMPLAGSASSSFNLLNSSLTASSGILKQTGLLTSDNTTGYGADIDLDATNNKLVWVGGINGADLLRCNTDGSNVETLSPGWFSWPTGVAVGGGKIFISDNGGGWLARCNPDGSGITAITGGAGQANDMGTLSDIEYYNSKIYYVNQPGFSGNFVIRQANTDGTGTTDLYSTANTIYGLALAAGTLYWTEVASGTSYVKSKPVSGGSVTTLASQATRLFNDIFIDAANALIYIADADINTYLDGTIKSIPLAGGSITPLLSVDGMAPSLVFAASATTLPVQFINISARQQNNANLVEWQVGVENNVDRYSIERSADGALFGEAGTVSAAGNAGYNWTDAHPLDNTTYYRVKAIDRDGKARYSNIVKLSASPSAAAGINVYPNAVTGKQFMLQLNNLPPASYTLQLYNMAGQPVFSKTILHTGGNATRAVVLPQTLPAGMYRLKLSGKEQYGLSVMVE